MNYFSWEFGASDEDYAKNNPLNITKINLVKPDHKFALISGQQISEWSPENCGFYDVPGQRLDCLVSSGAAFIKIISSNLMKYLADVTGDELQFLSLSIRSIDNGEDIQGYFVMINIGLVDCLNLEKTPHKKLGKFHFPFEIERARDYAGPYYFDTLRIPQERKIFRPAKRPDFILVREDLKDMLRDKGFTGLRFSEIDT